MKSKRKLIHQELSYKVNGLCFRVQNKLGRFCRERQYADLLEKELQNESVSYQREFEISNMNNNSPKGNKADFIIDNKIILELKAKRFTTKDDYYQIQRYLRGSGLEIGLIINFRNSYLKPKRILNTHLYNSDHSDVKSGSSGSRI
jgi:GxxExxY protein